MGQKPLEIGTFEAQFAKLITAKNRARGGTVRSLADTSGVSRSRLDRILRGETSITVTDIERISSALGLESWKVFFAIQTGRPYEEADAALAERLAGRRLAAEAEARAAADSDVSVPLPDDWEVSLAARRVENSPEAREDAFLNSLGEEPQE
ncbi:helix-turn-helix domain-containing protein [uncultured Actinomyces sp.]|uniref:helix-turn-helix domain-containing protein n=1 Tax=uncultured Actinomyces sp. TaxID=249061 RepID=UPI0025F30904|nr:helix-turn-helix transcriptional regulator [uncultured Actinomyces sp.]